jgi:imidazole glycerol-phosphate synthase subunit HisH
VSAPTRVTIFDYGAGNLHSLAKALAAPGVEARIDADAARAADPSATDVLVLPGVGAFTAAVERIGSASLAMRHALQEGLPTIGICLGMQLLFDESAEGPGAGLGIIPGRVTRLRAKRIPQIGWNGVHPIEGAHDPLWRDVPLDIAYYANSFVCRPDNEQCVTAWSEHEGDRFPAAVRAGRKGNVVGVQFHPEKSSAVGVRFLRAFIAQAITGEEVVR